jgi:alanyl-tRNA synthetase|tara:strand:- start:749 stop:862 length:114 start_codon:yes stop_codon:yes gene_type:complete
MQLEYFNVGSDTGELCGGTHVTNTDEIDIFKDFLSSL